MDIRIIHYEDGAYDVYDRTKDEFLFSTNLADDLFVWLSDMGDVRIQFVDLLIRNMHMLNLYK